MLLLVAAVVAGSLIGEVVGALAVAVVLVVNSTATFVTLATAQLRAVFNARTDRRSDIWAVAIPLATVPVLATQGVRIWRDRGAMARADTTDATAVAR